MEFSLLGGLAVRDGDQAIDLGGPKQRAVLAALLLERGRPVTADRLIHLVWGDEPPPRAEGSLQAYVSNLRKVLEPGRRPRQQPTVLVTRPAGYALEVDPGAVDLWRAAAAAERGRSLLGAGALEQAIVALDEALALWQGPLLPELADEAWVADATAGLVRDRARAIEDRVDAALALGRHAEVVPLLESAIADDPYHERFRAQLALALYRSGRQREALASLDGARRVLVEEVGIEPGRELRSLEQAILEQSPTLDPPGRGSVPAAPARPAPAAPAPAGATGGDAASALERPDGRPFVGRSHELELLVEALGQVGHHGGRPVVISGEPGIGKTRLAEELAARAGAAVVAWARCPESAAQAAYWPCVQLGRQLADAGVVEGDLVDSLLPDDDVLDGDPVADRLALHAAVAQVLASATRPLVLVIDDLQWADPASLRVLEFVAGELRRTPTLLVVTVRPVGLDAPEPLVDCLAEMARQPAALRLDLAGLSEADVGRWIALRAGQRAEPTVAGLVHDRTGGNAFFVGEVVELLAAEGRLADVETAARASTVPAAVQDVIRRRIAKLPVDTQRLLTSASVIGRTFDLDVLAAVAETDPGTVLDRLEPALDAALVADHDRPGRFQFAHALVTDTLVAELSSIRRARLHAAIASALLRLRGGQLDEDVAAIAHHAFEGAAAGVADDAYTWSVTAARLAAARLAHEDAADHWQRAARAVEVARPRDLRARHDALLEAGRALLRADAVAPAYEPLVAAIELGLATGDPAMVAAPAAAMNTEGLWLAGEIALSGVDALGALQRAVAALPDEPTVEKALALGALADNAYWQLPPDEIETISAEAVAVARATGDREVLARSLHKRNQSLWRPSCLAPRKAAAEELLALVEAEPTTPEMEAVALFGAASVSWEEGDVGLTRQRVARARAIAARLGTPALVTQLGFFQLAIDSTCGELGGARALLEETYELYRRTRRWAADPFRAAYLTILGCEQDDLALVDEVAPVILQSAYAPFFGEAVALAYVEMGHPERAEPLIASLPPLLDTWMLLGYAGAAAHNRVALGDRAGALALREVLEPYAGRLASAGTGSAIGDVDLALGRIATLVGEPEAARSHLDASVELLGRAGAVPWLVRALLARHELTGDDADLQRAAELARSRDLPLLQRRTTERQAISK